MVPCGAHLAGPDVGGFDAKALLFPKGGGKGPAGLHFCWSLRHQGSQDLPDPQSPEGKGNGWERVRTGKGWRTLIIIQLSIAAFSVGLMDSCIICTSIGLSWITMSISWIVFHWVMNPREAPTAKKNRGTGKSTLCHAGWACLQPPCYPWRGELALGKLGLGTPHTHRLKCQILSALRND